MNGFWKYAAIVTFSALCGLVTGEFIPNRNIATTKDIEQMKEAQVEANRKLDDMREQQATLIGELKGEGVIPKGGN